MAAEIENISPVADDNSLDISTKNDIMNKKDDSEADSQSGKTVFRVLR